MSIILRLSIHPKNQDDKVPLKWFCVELLYHLGCFVVTTLVEGFAPLFAQTRGVTMSILAAAQVFPAFTTLDQSMQRA
jgi:hypothetical protein